MPKGGLGFPEDTDTFPTLGSPPRASRMFGLNTDPHGPAPPPDPLLGTPNPSRYARGGAASSGVDLQVEQSQLLIVYCTLAAAPRVHATCPLKRDVEPGQSTEPLMRTYTGLVAEDADSWSPTEPLPDAPVLPTALNFAGGGGALATRATGSASGAVGAAATDASAAPPAAGAAGRAAALASAASMWPTSVFKWGFCIRDAADENEWAGRDMSVRLMLLRPVGECRLAQPTVFMWRLVRQASKALGPRASLTGSAASALGATVSLRRALPRGSATIGDLVFPATGATPAGAGTGGGATVDSIFHTPFSGIGGAGPAAAAASAACETLTYRVIIGADAGDASPYADDSVRGGVGAGGYRHGLDEGWRIMSKGLGTVRLGVHAGATATVEVVVLPVTLGHVPAPRLQLTKGMKVVGDEDLALLLVTP